MCEITGGFDIYRAGGDIVRKFKGVSGFSLLEVLVVIGVISILSAILMPSLNKARLQARRLVGRCNLRQIAQCNNVYSLDNNGRYPESVAKISHPLGGWNWSEPMLLIRKKVGNTGDILSMSTYLSGYITDADILSCPNVPKRFKLFQEAWDSGDDWDNPDPGPEQDTLSAIYCFYWNYEGYLEDRDSVFRGPKTSAGRRDESKLLVTDYFGYDHWKTQNSYGSCERFSGAQVRSGTQLSSSYWYRSEDEVGLDMIDVKPQAAFTDEHVEGYSSENVVGMRAIMDVETGEPYLDSIDGPGVFYLPRSAMY